jgi:hypothetical protein
LRLLAVIDLPTAISTLSLTFAEKKYNTSLD